VSNSTNQFVAKPHLAKPWIYFFATYAWTWSFFGIAYWLGLSAETGGILGAGLVMLALSGPALMAFIFVRLALNKNGQRDYWNRILDYKRISGRWYLAIFLFIPSIAVLSAIISGYWQFFSFANVSPSFLLTALVIPFMPLMEELGWRGYVLDRLQANYSAVISSLILGILWGLWHLPAFFLTGGGLSVMPFASLAFWEFIGGLTALSVCMSWIYNNTGRSTLSAILFHIVLEFWADTGLFPWESPDLACHLGFHVGLWAIVAVGIAAIYGTKNMSTQDKQPSKSTRVDLENEDIKPENEHDLGFQSSYTPYLNAQKVGHELKRSKPLEPKCYRRKVLRSS
jgi:membrane protease YdiL (CAAX protease family)